MISDYVTSLQPPEGLPISETLIDFPVPLQKLHFHLENPGLFPYPSITVMPGGLTLSAGRVSAILTLLSVSNRANRNAAPLHHPDLPELGAFLMKHKYACPFHPLHSSALMPILWRTLLMTANAFSCVCLFLKAAFKIISLGLIIFYRETNISLHFSVSFGFSSHLPSLW